MKPPVTPYSYGGRPIELTGYFKANIEFRGNVTNGNIYVPEKGDSVLSWPHQKHLGISLDYNSNPHALVQTTDTFPESLFKTFPKVCSGKVGCVPGNVHRIPLKEGEIPITSKVRSVPLSLQEAVKNMLNHL